MESPFKAIVTVFRNIARLNTDNTDIKSVSDFDDLDFSKTDLSPEAISALKEGRKMADDDEKDFEKVVARNSQPVTNPNVRTRSQVPSRSDIVKGEAIERDDENDQEPERTIGPKH